MVLMEVRDIVSNNDEEHYKAIRPQYMQFVGAPACTLRVSSTVTSK